MGESMVINMKKIRKTKDKDGYYNYKCDCGKQQFLVNSNAKKQVIMTCVTCGTGRLV